MKFDYMFKIRILHLCIAVVLAWGSINHLYNKKVPTFWYILVLLLAIAAGSYHGYQFIKNY